MKNITITLNERPIKVSAGTKLFQLITQHKPNADILVLNGIPVQNDCQLQEGDTVVLIKRGEIPSKEDLEALLVARDTPKVYERLNQSCVGIAGLGGLGSTIAIALARVGIGKLVLIDHDVVEPSNLNRQQYFVEHIGVYKTDAIRDILEKIHPFLDVVTHQTKVTERNVVELLGAVDVIVEAVDGQGTKQMLIDQVREKFPQMPLVSGVGIAGYGDNNSITTRKKGNLYICGDEQAAHNYRKGLMAPRVGVVANMQANQVVEILVKRKRKAV